MTNHFKHNSQNWQVPDRFSKEIRSKIMASIRSKDTKPEMTIRKLVWASGKRYRVHDRTVIGTPDMSNKRKKVAIFIDGCFWHGCARCYTEPRTNSEFWKGKIMANRKRRDTVVFELKNMNWKVLEFWEHQIRENPKIASEEISLFL